MSGTHVARRFAAAMMFGAARARDAMKQAMRLALAPHAARLGPERCDGMQRSRCALTLHRAAMRGTRAAVAPPAAA
jgi:hypothetical protein